MGHSLKTGGSVNLLDFHPINDFIAGDAYFESGKTDVGEAGTYSENCTGEKSTLVTWPQSLSELIRALINAGIAIEVCHEYPYSPYDCFADAQWVLDKGYQLLFKDQQVPLNYAIKGRKL
ncbi:MAG: hypothetical protein MJK10_17800 [Pseudomonadales bacterium]|nr:hypothetical protein [Pseudomonadales bacterium]